ncbi:MAG: hypothetical protein KDK33_16915 [Leptospiraceae bacterium]|nr:hypothetical protein [Leptospiraceae bacterium]
MDCRDDDPACGGGSTAAVLMLTSCEAVTGTLDSLASEDGAVTDVPSATTAGTPVLMGDIPGGTSSQAFFHFDISSLGQARVVSANLEVFQSSLSGVPSSVGPFNVDHVDYGTLDISDFGTSGLDSGFAQISDYTSGSYKIITVTSQLAVDIAAGRSYSQYRIRSGNNADATADAVNYDMGDSVTNKPLLRYSICQ